MLNDYYKGKRVLVTGGCGSIGKKIVAELLKYVKSLFISILFKE